MHLSGQTPLFRAKNLEKHVGIAPIYLKLEGSNPTGHKNDRITESLIQYAMDQGHQKILVYGSDPYMRSVVYFAQNKGLDLYGVKNRHTLKQQKAHPSIDWLSISKNPRMRYEETYERYAKDNGFFFLCETDNKPFIRTLSLQKMAEEIYDKVPEMTHLWTQATSGSTLYSLYHETLRQWVNQSISSLPNMICGTTHDRLSSMSYDASLKEIMTSSKTMLLPVDPHALKETAHLIRKLENIVVSQNEAYALSAFLNHSKTPSKEGVHVIVLNDGKSVINVKEISKQAQHDVDDLVTTTRRLLTPYQDSIEETKDAIKTALELGYIFTATDKHHIQGICVIVPTGFDAFIPSYHLAYIGVLKDTKGRGLATALIQQAIEKTQGNLSLHVDKTNKSAKKLYEKMGFIHAYDRMLYKG